MTETHTRAPETVFVVWCSHLNLCNDERRERLVVHAGVFSQHVDPLRFRETRDLQRHRT